MDLSNGYHNSNAGISIQTTIPLIYTKKEVDAKVYSMYEYMSIKMKWAVYKKNVFKFLDIIANIFSNKFQLPNKIINLRLVPPLEMSKICVLKRFYSHATVYRRQPEVDSAGVRWWQISSVALSPSSGIIKTLCRTSNAVWRRAWCVKTSVTTMKSECCADVVSHKTVAELNSDKCSQVQ